MTVAELKKALSELPLETDDRKVYLEDSEYGLAGIELAAVGLDDDGDVALKQF